MDILLWIIQGMLAGVFLMTGITKLIKSKDRLLAQGMGVLSNLRPFEIKIVGLLEVLGSVGIILPWALDVHRFLTLSAAAGLAGIMIVAGFKHSFRSEYKMVLVNVGLLTLAVLVAVGRLAELRQG